MNRTLRKIHVIDSHTGGEPTRVVVAGGPDLGSGSMTERREVFRSQFDRFRSAIVNEPRGSDVMVGAVLLEPVDPSCAAGVIFFNNVGFIGMCGHGTIGVVTTLAYLRRIVPGEHRIETPVGVVTARLHESGAVSVQNVPSFRFKCGVTVSVEGYGDVKGAIAWGGNWFFLVDDPALDLSLDNVEALTDYTWRIRQALDRNGVTGADGALIDHVEISGSARNPAAHSRNFVLCPGKAYDRSPCGTGTSAKLACLFADGRIREGETWRQESITGSVFEGTVNVINDQCVPTIKGRAFVNAETTLILNPDDPCCWGIGG